MTTNDRSPACSNPVLEGAVRDALDSSGDSWLRGIDVFATTELVTLKGRVPSFYFKQLALAAALRVPGVIRVHNELEVVAPIDL